MADRANLRVVDDNGELVEDAVVDPRIVALTDALAERDRTIQSLKDLLRDGDPAKPTATDNVRQVFDHWRAVCGHEKAVLAEKRAKAVQRMLRAGYTVEQLCRAVDGCAAAPFVTDAGRSATGRRSDRYDDLELICRDETKVDAFIARAPDPDDQNQPELPGVGQPPAGRGHVPSPLDRAIAALKDEFGDRVMPCDFDEDKLRYRYYLAPCPIHPAVGTPMRIVQEGDSWAGNRVLFFACANGCTHEDLFDAVRQIELRYDHRRAEAVSRARAVA